MITKFARLEFELFTKPSKLDFLQVYQALICKKDHNFSIPWNQAEEFTYAN
jgi:hypothetical protein